MLKWIRKVVNNLSFNPENGCSAVLETEEQLYALSRLYNSHPEALSLLVAACLYEYSRDNSYTADEFRAYKKGVTDIIEKFRLADDEVQERIAKQNAR